jgi:D-threo-aldose 1-dehydrogenase
VDLRAAALQFVLAHPAIASVIPGARSIAEVEENVALIERPIPAGLWADLKDARLLDPAAPTPGSQP